MNKLGLSMGFRRKLEACGPRLLSVRVVSNVVNSLED